MAETFTTTCGGGEKIRGKTGVMWQRCSPNMSSTTQKHMCLMRWKSRPGMNLEQDLSPTWSLATLERTVSRTVTTHCIKLLLTTIKDECGTKTSWWKLSLTVSSVNCFTFDLYCKATRAPLRGICCYSSSDRTKPFSYMHTSSLFVFLLVHSEPTDAPTDLRVSKVDSTKANIHWKPVDPNSVQGEFKEYRVRLDVIFLLQTNSRQVLFCNLLPSQPINPFLYLLPPSCTTGVSPVWSRVWWSVKRRKPRVSTALWSSHLASSATWCPSLNTRCSWLWPTAALRAHPAIRWNSPPRREVRTGYILFSCCQHCDFVSGASQSVGWSIFGSVAGGGPASQATLCLFNNYYI